MLTLRELQAAFGRSVSGDAPDELLQVIAADGCDPTARLSIYRNNVVTRLTAALATAYPVVSRLVDQRFFGFAAYEFLRGHLPASGCLGEYGGDFPDFLAAFPPAAALEYLADVARLEWAIHEVRHAAVLPPVTLESLAAMRGDPAQFRLRLAPTVRFVASAHAADSIWVAHQPGNTWDNLRLESASVHLQINGARGLGIVRLAPSTWEFRAGLAAGESLGAAIAAAPASASDFDPPAALAALFSEQLVVGFCPPFPK